VLGGLLLVVPTGTEWLVGPHWLAGAAYLWLAKVNEMVADGRRSPDRRHQLPLAAEEPLPRTFPVCRAAARRRRSASV